MQNILSKHIKDRIPKNATREEIWLTIIDGSRHELMFDLKCKIDEVPAFTVEIFFYGDFSDRVAHGLDISDEVNSLDIVELLKLIEAPRDEPYRETIEILISDLNLKEYELPKQQSPMSPLRPKIRLYLLEVIIHPMYKVAIYQNNIVFID